MNKAAVVLASVLISTGAARAENQPAAPATPPVTDFSQGVGPHAMPVLPSPAAAPAAPPAGAPADAPAAPEAKPAPSPVALACANSSGATAPAQRVEACSALIDSHKWTGKDIAWAYANRCAALALLKQYEKALADCSEAIAQDDNQATAHELRGQLYNKHGDSAEALADFDKAVALGANSPALFSRRGLLRLLAGDPRKALESFDREVEIAGGSADSWLDRGSAWLGVGDDAKAEQDFAKATELSPNDPQTWLNRGVAALSAGDKAKAAEYFGEALKRDPNQTYAALWRFLARDGAAQAKSDLLAFAEKAPKTWPYAVTQLYLGRASAAQTLAAAESADQQCEAQFYIARHQLMKGDAKAAAPGFKRAAETCPKNFIEYFRAVAELKKAEAAK
jgi:lipoprotein NlpI